MQFIIVWPAYLLLIGLTFMPLSGWIFRRFEDRGWLFSRTLGLLVCGAVLWALNVARVVPFTGGACRWTLAVFACLNWGAYFVFGRKAADWNLRPALRTVLVEEAIFLLYYLLCVYIVGFLPWIRGIEKFMDYGFLKSMLRDEWMPFKDMWLAGENINYYYGGQFLVAFLAKLSGVPAGYAYNLMRATVAAFSLTLPFAICYQLMRDKAGPLSRAPWMAGALGGAAVGLAGNGHYLLYGLFQRTYQLVTGQPVTYWMWHSRSYIGGSVFKEKNNHEFPAISSVNGDLHAHYINLIFVLTIAAMLYAWAQKRNRERNGTLFPLRNSVLETALMGAAVGLFMWINYWDYPIYLVVCGSIIFFSNLAEYRPNYGKFLAVTALEAAVMLACGRLAALPFTLNYRMIYSTVKLTYTHSPLLDLAVVWGFQAIVTLAFIVWLFVERRRALENCESAGLSLPDMCVLLLSLCAAGLVLMPELVYVKDIYAEQNYRSNTMFKLTYQAFILFGICVAYIVTRAFRSESSMAREYGRWGAALILAMSTFSLHACSYEFGDILKISNRIGADGSKFIERFYPEDAGAIAWMEKNIKGRPVVLEAPGKSYSEYERVSVATGLPTVIGWRVHEWLWSGNRKMVDRRRRDVDAIYTSKSPRRVSSMLNKYDVSYVYIGKMERELYGRGLNLDALNKVCEPVYSDDRGLLLKVVKTGAGEKS